MLAGARSFAKLNLVDLVDFRHSLMEELEQVSGMNQHELDCIRSLKPNYKEQERIRIFKNSEPVHSWRTCHNCRHRDLLYTCISTIKIERYCILAVTGRAIITSLKADLHI